MIASGGAMNEIGWSIGFYFPALLGLNLPSIESDE